VIDGVYLKRWKACLNLGDALSPVIVREMLNRRRQFCVETPPRNRRLGARYLLAVGSVINDLGVEATVWGSGILNEKYGAKVAAKSREIRLDIRAVRGPITQKLLVGMGYRVPSVYGDPAMLMPLFYTPQCTEKRHDFGVVLHFRSARQLPGLHTIPVQTEDYQAFIEDLVSCRIVISSSLHGIILAESYGVPAVFLCEERQQADLMKYLDYYYSTDRYPVRIAYSLQEALAMPPMPLPQNLDGLRRGLIRAFPYDLWKVR